MLTLFSVEWKQTCVNFYLMCNVIILCFCPSNSIRRCKTGFVVMDENLFVLYWWHRDLNLSTLVSSITMEVWVIGISKAWDIEVNKVYVIIVHSLHNVLFNSIFLSIYQMFISLQWSIEGNCGLRHVLSETLWWIKKIEIFLIYSSLQSTIPSNLPKPKS